MDKRAAAGYCGNYERQGVPVVRLLERRCDFATFLDLPRQLYRADPHWVQPLGLERRQHLSRRNPVFEHLDWQGWIAWRGPQPVGRITARLDYMHQQYHGNNTGYFGMLEAEDDAGVFAALTGERRGLAAPSRSPRSMARRLLSSWRCQISTRRSVIWMAVQCCSVG